MLCQQTKHLWKPVLGKLWGKVLHKEKKRIKIRRDPEIAIIEEITCSEIAKSREKSICQKGKETKVAQEMAQKTGSIVLSIQAYFFTIKHFFLDCFML